MKTCSIDMIRDRDMIRDSRERAIHEQLRLYGTPLPRVGVSPRPLAIGPTRHARRAPGPPSPAALALLAGYASALSPLGGLDTPTREARFVRDAAAGGRRCALLHSHALNPSDG
jgi:hypothetical protein